MTITAKIDRFQAMLAAATQPPFFSQFGGFHVTSDCNGTDDVLSANKAEDGAAAAALMNAGPSLLAFVRTAMAAMERIPSHVVSYYTGDPKSVPNPIYVAMRDALARLEKVMP